MIAQQYLTNPLEETTAVKIADPCVVVIFGATGDLTSRKLLPALYNLKREGQLPAHFATVGFARRDKTDEQFRQEMLDAVNKHSRVKPVDMNIWNNFSEQIFYHRSEFDNDAGYEELARRLETIDDSFGTKGNRIFYLSVPPSYFEDIVKRLAKHGLIYDAEQVKNKWSRVIIEKPFGRDLHSALALQKSLSEHIKEEQIYRIDHWLGKETVQNLLVMRFGNSIFESIWNNNHIDCVQITVAEDLGVGTRGKFWEEAGMLRDIVQNHVMQLLSLVAMEPPVNVKADSIHDEKVKVLQSIRPINRSHIDDSVVRGQYGPGFVLNEAVKGYRQEDNVDPHSNVESYVAMKLYIDSWRWAGVPFYLRAGKRLPKKATEIAVCFKKAPGMLFKKGVRRDDSNILVIRIQPDEGISLRINSKVPGINNPIQPVKMDFRYGSYFGIAPPEAYERLICDCILGDSTLFAREDEVMQSWKFLEPIQHHFEEVPAHDLPNYAAGTWGPEAAEQMMQRDGRNWRFL